MAIITRDGLVTQVIAEIKEQIEELQLAQISPNLDLTSTSILGQLNSIFSTALADLEEQLLALYSQLDPDQAEGDALDRLSNITGTIRRASQRTQVSASLTFSQNGTFSAGQLIARPVGSSVLFSNVSPLTISSAPTTASNVLFRAQEGGPTALNYGPSGPLTLTQIVAPQAGWQTIQATSGLFVGTAGEDDEALRERRRAELARGSAATTNGIIAALYENIPNLLGASLTVNTSSVTANSLPPHSFEAIVWAPSTDNDLIAQTIFAAKSADAATWGDISRDVADSAGNLHTIRFSTVTEVAITSIVLNIGYIAGKWIGAEATKAIIADRIRALVPGRDINQSMLISWAMSADGVHVINSATINGGASLTINDKQIAALSSLDNITITAGVVQP
jgi:hypothetical protein